MNAIRCRLRFSHNHLDQPQIAVHNSCSQGFVQRYDVAQSIAKLIQVDRLVKRMDEALNVGSRVGQKTRLKGCTSVDVLDLVHSNMAILGDLSHCGIINILQRLGAICSHLIDSNGEII